MSISIRHDAAQGRFVAEIEGPEAHLDYEALDEQRLDFKHTFVPVEQRGKGLAGLLVRAGLEYARSSGFRVLPTCPFVKKFIERNPEFQDVAVAGSVGNSSSQ